MDDPGTNFASPASSRDSPQESTLLAHSAFSGQESLTALTRVAPDRNAARLPSATLLASGTARVRCVCWTNPLGTIQCRLMLRLALYTVTLLAPSFRSLASLWWGNGERPPNCGPHFRRGRYLKRQRDLQLDPRLDRRFLRTIIVFPAPSAGHTSRIHRLLRGGETPDPATWTSPCCDRI